MQLRTSLVNRSARSAWALLASLLVALSPALGQINPVGAENTIGVNKFDLLRQYFGTASGGDGGTTYRKVTQAQAEKSIFDAHMAHIRYVRIAAMGYSPSNPGELGDLALWWSEPEAYWKIVDQMMRALEEQQIQLIPSFVWNLQQLPTMFHETVRTLLTDPDSQSSRALMRYIAEFVMRYRSTQDVLFYEVGNELNLQADLDDVGRCKTAFGKENCDAHGNFSTDELIGFTSRVARSIHALDPSRPVSSGHSFPRPSAQHLRRRPEFSPSGPDWTQDDFEELSGYMAETHSGLDIISVHIYEETDLPAKLVHSQIEMLPLAARVSRSLGKPLFVGEFGGVSQGPLQKGSFVAQALRQIEALSIPFSALWIWEIDQTAPYSRLNHDAARFDIEPGYSIGLLQELSKINGPSVSQMRAANGPRPPIVIITWPLDCDRVGTFLHVRVSASDAPGAPASVSVQLDSRDVIAWAHPPYEAALDSLAPGKHDIIATAVDLGGRSSSWKARVFVDAAARSEQRCAACCN